MVLSGIPLPFGEPVSNVSEDAFHARLQTECHTGRSLALCCKTQAELRAYVALVTASLPLLPPGPLLKCPPPASAHEATTHASLTPSH